MQFLADALSQSTGTFAVVSTLCGIGVIVAMDYFENPIAGFVLLPIAILASLGISQIFADNLFYNPRSFSDWLLHTIFAATAGLGASMGGYMLLSRLAARMRDGGSRSQVEWRVRHIRLDSSE